MGILQMFEWLSHNMQLFLVNYTEVGYSQAMALELQEEHAEFTENAMVSRGVYLTSFTSIIPQFCNFTIPHFSNSVKYT